MKDIAWCYLGGPKVPTEGKTKDCMRPSWIRKQPVPVPMVLRHPHQHKGDYFWAEVGTPDGIVPLDFNEMLLC